MTTQAQRYVIKELKLPGILYLIYIFTFKYKGYIIWDNDQQLKTFVTKGRMWKKGRSMQGGLRGLDACDHF